jgi:uncharacterized membrane protein
MVLLRSTFAALAIALTSLFAGPASAAEGDLTFCNKFAHRIYVAISYPQTSVPNFVWYLARGWLQIEPGECYVFDTALKTDTIYYHAESDPYKEGKKKFTMKWGNEKEFAVRDAHFHLYNAEKKYSGTYLAKFSKLASANGGLLTCTITFIDSATNTACGPRQGEESALRAAPPPASAGAPPIGDKGGSQ